MRRIKELVDEEFKHKQVPEFNLTSEEYSQVLDSVVIANVDIICHTGEGNVLLGERSDKPLRHKLWIFGGRMKPGESLRETAKRNIKRKLGINPNPECLNIGDTYNIMWRDRHEPPQEFGFQTLMTYKCNPEEAQQAIAADKTHRKLKWYSRKELYDLEEAGELHRFLPEILRDAHLL